MKRVDTAADWQPNLTSPRLRLRPLAEEDFDSLYSAASDPLIWKQHPDRYRYTREKFEAYFQSGMESKGAMAVFDRRSGEMIGSSRFRDHNAEQSSVEIGYTFLIRKFWGTGYNDELKRLMLDHAFRFVNTVLFVVGLENQRSRGALSKIGAVKAGDEFAQTNSKDSVVYRMTKASWMERVQPVNRSVADKPLNLKTRSWWRPGYEISTDAARLDLDFVHRELSQSYWSPGIPRSVVEKAIANSIVFGLYRQDGRQAGFARLVTDAATFAYLCDVIITESERGTGLGKWLNECVVGHPDLQGLRRWVLATRDAHSLYQKTGWTALKDPVKFMERHLPDVYKAQEKRSR